MNIYIVSPTLNNGGAERVAAMLANGFILRGHRVTFITKKYGSHFYSLNEKIIIKELFPKSAKGTAKIYASIRNISSYIKEERPDIIIGVMWFCALMGRLASIGKNIPVIMCEHSAFERAGCKFSKFDYFCKYYLNYVYTAVSVLTEADRLLIKDRFKNVVVIPNPLPFTIKSKTFDNYKTVLSAGRIDDWYIKGFDILLNAWASVSKIHPDWKLLIAGKGTPENMKFLQQIVQRNCISHSVFFLGLRADIQDLYQQASIYVSSSRSEGLPMVVLEAMSQGCACVATDFKGRTQEIFDSKEKIEYEDLLRKKNECLDTGVICKPGDIEALAEGIDIMIKNIQYRHDVQKKSVKRAEYYSLDNIITMWEDFILKIINNK